MSLGKSSDIKYLKEKHILISWIHFLLLLKIVIRLYKD
jgi:hypothetical protein